MEINRPTLRQQQAKGWATRPNFGWKTKSEGLVGYMPFEVENTDCYGDLGEEKFGTISHYGPYTDGEGAIHPFQLDDAKNDPCGGVSFFGPVSDGISGLNPVLYEYPIGDGTESSVGWVFAGILPDCDFLWREIHFRTRSVRSVGDSFGKYHWQLFLVAAVPER